MSDETTEVTPTSDDASSTGDALAAFVNEDDAPEEREENQPLPRKAEAKAPERRAAPKREEPKEGDDEPEKPKAAAEGEEEPKEPAKPRTYRQKVNGQELELDADAVDAIAQKLGLPAQEILSGASLKRAAYEKMREAAELRRTTEQAQSLAKKDPAAALKLLGLAPEDVDRFAQARAYERFTAEVDPQTGQPLTPEQKRLRELEGREQERLRAEQEAQSRVQQEEEAKARGEAERHWTKVLVTHLEKTGDPKHILPRVAAHLGDAIEADASTDPADLLDDAVALAWDDIHAEHAKLYGAMPYETLRERFPDLVEKVRKGLVSDWKARAGQKPPERQPERIERSAGRKPRTTADVFAEFVNGR